MNFTVKTNRNRPTHYTWYPYKGGATVTNIPGSFQSKMFQLNSVQLAQRMKRTISVIFWLQDQIRVRRLGSSVEYWQLNSWDLANCTREWTLCSRGQTFFFFFVFQCWAPERNLWTLRRSPKNVAWIFTAVCLLCNNQPWTSNYVRLNWWPISKLQMAIHWTQRVERAITNNCHVGAKRGRCTFHNEPHTVQVN